MTTTQRWISKIYAVNSNLSSDNYLVWATQCVLCVCVCLNISNSGENFWMPLNSSSSSELKATSKKRILWYVVLTMLFFIVLAQHTLLPTLPRSVISNLRSNSLIRVSISDSLGPVTIISSTYRRRTIFSRLNKNRSDMHFNKMIRNSPVPL